MYICGHSMTCYVMQCKCKTINDEKQHYEKNSWNSVSLPLYTCIFFFPVKACEKSIWSDAESNCRWQVRILWTYISFVPNSLKVKCVFWGVAKMPNCVILHLKKHCSIIVTPKALDISILVCRFTSWGYLISVRTLNGSSVLIMCWPRPLRMSCIRTQRTRFGKLGLYLVEGSTLIKYKDWS